MDIGAISAGPDPPKDIYAVIEIPLGGAPVKYELVKASGALMVHRFLHTAMFYPGNYGFIPKTLSADGATRTFATTEICRRSCASRSRISFSTTRTWKRANGSPSSSGST